MSRGQEDYHVYQKSRQDYYGIAKPSTFFATTSQADILRQVGTTTTTVTTTTTSSKTVATTTINAACRRPDNYADTLNGDDLVEANPGPPERPLAIVQFPVADAFACCNAAFAARSEADEATAPEIFGFDRRTNPDNANEIIGFCTLLGTETRGTSQADGPWLLRNREDACDPVDQPGVVAGPVLGNAPFGQGLPDTGACQ